MDAMKNCKLDKTLAIIPNPPDTSIDSAVFEAVQNLASANAQVGTPPNFSSVPFNNVDLSATVGGTGGAALNAPSYSPPSVPTPSYSIPSLSGAAYNAVAGAISYAFSAPTINGSLHGNPEDAQGTLNNAPASPPVDYPEADLLELFDWVKPAGPSRPTMDVEEYPEWMPIRRYEFEPLGLEQLGFDYSDLVYEPPDIAEMERRAELVYEDDLGLRERIRNIIEQSDDEVTQWLRRTTQENFMRVALRGRKEKASKEIEQAFEAAAARNISLPYGGLDAVADEIAQAELDEKYVSIQEVRNEVYEAATNAMVTSMQRALQIERNHFQLFMRYARQNLEVYKLNLQLATTAYESVLGIFSGLVQVINTEVDSYNQYISAVQAQNSALGEQASLTQAQVQSFLAKVQAYSTRIDVKRAATEVVATDVQLQTMDIEAYAERLKADLANIQIIEQNIDAFRKAIKVHSDNFKWYESVMSAYEAWISAKASAIDVNKEKVQGYSRLWSAEDRRISAYSDYVSQSISQLEAELQAYNKAVSAQREYFSGISQAASSTMQAMNAYASSVREVNSGIRDYNAADVAFQAAQNSQQIADAKIELAQQSIEAEASAQTTRLEAARAAAQVVAAGSLAQAGATMFQVSYAARGSTSENVSGQDVGVRQSNFQTSKAWRRACRSSYNYSENAPE